MAARCYSNSSQRFLHIRARKRLQHTLLVLLPSGVTLMFSALAMDLFASQSTLSTLMSVFSSHNLHNCSRARGCQAQSGGQVLKLETQRHSSWCAKLRGGQEGAETEHQAVLQP